MRGRGHWALCRSTSTLSFARMVALLSLISFLRGNQAAGALLTIGAFRAGRTRDRRTQVDQGDFGLEDVGTTFNGSGCD